MDNNRSLVLWDNSNVVNEDFSLLLEELESHSNYLINQPSFNLMVEIFPTMGSYLIESLSLQRNILLYNEISKLPIDQQQPYKSSFRHLSFELLENPNYKPIITRINNNSINNNSEIIKDNEKININNEKNKNINSVVGNESNNKIIKNEIKAIDLENDIYTYPTTPKKTTKTIIDNNHGDLPNNTNNNNSNNKTQLSSSLPSTPIKPIPHSPLLKSHSSLTASIQSKTTPTKTPIKSNNSNTNNNSDNSNNNNNNNNNSNNNNNNNNIPQLPQPINKTEKQLEVMPDSYHNLVYGGNTEICEPTTDVNDFPNLVKINYAKTLRGGESSYLRWRGLPDKIVSDRLDKGQSKSMKILHKFPANTNILEQKFIVKGESTLCYEVLIGGSRNVCSCEDYYKRHQGNGFCKHIAHAFIHGLGVPRASHIIYQKAMTKKERYYLFIHHDKNVIANTRERIPDDIGDPNSIELTTATTTTSTTTTPTSTPKKVKTLNSLPPLTSHKTEVIDGVDDSSNSKLISPKKRSQSLNSTPNKKAKASNNSHEVINLD
ncbi:hypothetical protein RB653_003722 [Dictyostelium firmibasis]|uniref:SWIM-type domain-containing protein n=1 Tax=Dictyostelium firmibasis TaxID=79012 RepID=A0AAN7YRU5_9MYCE